MPSHQLSAFVATPENFKTRAVTKMTLTLWFHESFQDVAESWIRDGGVISPVCRHLGRRP
jgi:hypothetical protein